MTVTSAPTLWSRFKGLIFHLFPHHRVSRMTYWLTRRQGWSRRPMISLFVRFFKVDMSEAAESNPLAYPTFNAFFIRAMKPDVRPIAPGSDIIVSAADGRVSQAGGIADGRIFQAKGHSYTVEELLGGDSLLAAPFRHGRFITIYLSPRDYHRVHMPLDGLLETMVYVPGRLFSVAPYAVTVIPRLFARNERMAALFSSNRGRFAVVMIGAVNVAAIETAWHGLVTPPRAASVRRCDYRGRNLHYERGAEIARFNMGSTAILLFEESMAELDPALAPESSLRMGQAIGRCLSAERKPAASG